METYTGMDVAWCLTCSKSTADAQSTYCSEACRLADCEPTPSSSSNVPITSPVPNALYSSPRMKPIDRRRSSVSPTKPSTSRPAFASRATNIFPPASEAAFSPPKMSSRIPRDRRAFSFPSAPNSPPLLFANREHRSSTTLPPFARRDIVASLTPRSPALGAVNEDGLRFQQVLARRLAKSTGGANTPGTEPESVFISTSESSDGEDEPPVRSAPPFLAPPRAISGPGPSTQFSTLRNQLSLGRTNSLQSRSTSNSPVAAMVASSASSRSREDIISWAKAIDRRNGADDVEEDAARGRPRTTRLSGLARVPPPSTEPLDEHAEDEGEAENDDGSMGMGTTPKGRIGSALAGLSGYGGSIVKALTSVTALPSRPATLRKTTTSGRPGSSTLDFTTTPSPAEVAKVDVVASTMPLDDPPQFMMGGTATLSTASFSEALDPSVIGTHDQVEIATDGDDGGMSASSSGFRSRRHRQGASRKDSIVSVPPPVPERQQRPPPSTRPITSTLWSLSSYFTRFAPFALSSVTSPQSARPTNPSHPSSSSTIPSVVSSATATPEDEATAPLPAARSRPDTPESPAQQLVRSIPMDIAMPQCLPSERPDFQVHEPPADRDRLRSSRSRARSRSRRRSRSRSLSAGRVLDRYAPPRQQQYDLKGVGMSNQDPDADADVSDEEGGVAERGRGRRDRGRGRDAVEEKDRARGRGRDRSVKGL